jgi:hypothetical protein
VLVADDNEILESRAQKLMQSTKTSTCSVPTSSSLVEEMVVETSCRNGGSWLDMIPKYKSSKTRLTVSRSSIIKCIKRLKTRAAGESRVNERLARQGRVGVRDRGSARAKAMKVAILSGSQPLKGGV